MTSANYDSSLCGPGLYIPSTMSFVKKRKWDEIEDSDEEPSFGRQILPVANLPDDYDGIPQNGMEYLFTVR
jgi:hypothetical protein